MYNQENNPFIEAKKCEDQENFELALQKYEEAIDLGIGDQALAYQGKGRALARLGRLEEALIECQEALKLNPELPIVHGVLGYIYRLQTKPDLAAKELLIALNLDPSDFISLANLAGLYFNLGRYQEATKLFEKFVHLQPENIEMQVYLVQSYIGESSFQKSITQLNKIFIAKPTIFTIYILYVIILVTFVGQYFSRLNILTRMGVGLGLYLVALLFPLFLSIPIGILLSIFLLLVVVTNLWLIKYNGIALSIFQIFLIGCFCIAYWVAVGLHWLHQTLQLSGYQTT